MYKGFLSSEKKEDEIIVKFNQWFNMVMHSIPQEMYPLKDVAMTSYLNAFKGELVFNHWIKTPLVSSNLKT